MSASTPTVLALDFDGVLCDGLKEYFLTSWRAYCTLWQLQDSTPPTGLAETFYRLRPVVETGWEMPVLLRAIVLGMAETEVLESWGTIAQQIVQKENLDPATLAAKVDGVRDQWIATDPGSWLAEHGFYPGVIDRLQTMAQINPVRPVIISTKEGRFIRELLQQQGVDLEHIQIYGKEAKRPKHQILRELMATYVDTASFWFVEDRLKTLQGVQHHADLDQVELFLADWGYNTDAERAAAKQDPRIHLLSLKTFSQDFSVWI